MRFVHISDLHIGKRVNGMPMLEDQRHVLAQIVQLARDEGAQAVVIAGDIYDKASPSAEAVTVFDAFLTDLACAGICVLAVPGNHDSAERIAYAQGLLANQGVSFPPVYAGEIEHVEIHDEHGPVVFWLVPFLKPGDVRRFFPDADIGDDYGAALSAALGACDIDPAKRNVAVSHQFVTARAASPERADDEIQLGGIDAVDVSTYDAFDYVALGHVHRSQRIGRETARYSGSPLKYSFSEARYEKGALVVDLHAKSAKDPAGACAAHRFVALSPLHDMREVRTTLEDLLASATTQPEAVEDYLHVTLTDEHPQLDAMARIHEAFPNAMTLDYENAAILAARENVRHAIDPDEQSATDLFARFYEEQVGTPLDGEQIRMVDAAVRAVDEQMARGEESGQGGRR